MFCLDLNELLWSAGGRVAPVSFDRSLKTSLISAQFASKAQSSQNDLLAFNLTNEMISLLLSSGKKLNVNIALGQIVS